MEPILLRPAKAAQLADISRSVAYDLIAKGEWPAVRVGRSLRVPVKDLVAWVEANKHPSKPSSGSEMRKDQATTHPQ
jgi:excisionase family DNA binding protein